MASLAGGLASSARFAGGLYHAANLDAARALTDRSLAFRHSRTKAASRATIGAPVSQTVQSFGGGYSGSLRRNFYNRLWLSPRAADFGNLVTEQQVSVNLWNSFFSVQTLQAAQLVDLDGVALEGDNPPLPLPALFESIFTLKAGLSGAPLFNGQVIFQVTGFAPLAITVTGQRLIAFTFAPNWAGGIKERLAWKTEILASEAGYEQRRALRATPRRQLSASFLLHAHERQRLAAMLPAWGARVFAVPIWMQAVYLSADLAAGSDFIALANPQGFTSIALLATASGLYEVVTIESISASGLALKQATLNAFPAGCALYPLRRCYLEKPPAITRKTDALWQVKCDFIQAETEPHSAELPATLHQGTPVLEQAPDESRDITLTYQRLTQALDNQTAPLHIYDQAKRAFIATAHRFLCADRAEREALIALLYGLSGRQKAIFIPTFADDFALAAPLAANDLQMRVLPTDRARFFEPFHLRIELNDGTALHRFIAHCETQSDGLERLTLSSPPGQLILPENVRRISRLQLARQDSDSVTLEHLSDGVCRINTVFKEVRDEL